VVTPQGRFRRPWHLASGIWHLVRTIRDTSFGSIYDPGLRGVKLLAVSFHDETPELVLNQTDQVEFAVPRPLRLPES
jgi:hypothetical protein